MKMKTNTTNTNNNSMKAQLTPVSSNVSYLGTTVSYGIAGANNWNNSFANSGNTWGATTVNAANNYNSWGASGVNAYNTSSNFWNNNNAVQYANGSNNYPTVSANNYGQQTSGNFYAQQANGNFYGQQYNQQNQWGQYSQSKLVQPSVDISETSSDIVISAYVSSEVLNDLSLNVSEDSVTISGSLWTGNDNFLLMRTIPLTTSVRAEACTATLQSGILDIRLPKTEKSSRNKVTITKDVIE